MKTNNYVLSYDLGTQSVRAIIFDNKGNTVKKTKIVYEEPYFSLKHGYAEQTAEFYWENLCQVTKRLKSSCDSQTWENLSAVSITTCRDVITCLDKNNTPLRPFILYLDQRRVENVEKYFSSLRIRLLKMVGIWDMASDQMRATPGNWILENEPEVWGKTHKICMLSGYMHLKLTGELCDSAACQVGHVPFDYKKKCWQSPNSLSSFVCRFGRDKMVDNLYSPCEIMGKVSAKVAEETGLPIGIPIVASGADKSCETLGVGCEGNDVAAISLGTSASIEITTDKYVEPAPFVPAYSSLYADKYNPEVLIYRGFWMLSWFKKEFAQEEIALAKEKGCVTEAILDSKMEAIPVGCDGLVIQPYWSPTINYPKAKGSMIGFSDCHNRMHIYRAIIEGIGFALYKGMLDMEKQSGYKINRIAVSGGGSCSKQVCQLMSDLFGLPFYKVQTSETSALGSAMASFTAIKEYSSLSETVKNMHRVEETFTPNMKNNERYRQIYTKVYTRIIRKNYKTFRNISNLNK